MALNPIAYTEKIVRSFLRYQLSAYPFADPRLHAQMWRATSASLLRLAARSAPEEAWRECHFHARNLLGPKGYQALLDEVDGKAPFRPAPPRWQRAPSRVR